MVLTRGLEGLEVWFSGSSGLVYMVLRRSLVGLEAWFSGS